MRILLVDPHLTQEERSLPNIGLAYIASSLQIIGYQVDITEFYPPKWAPDLGSIESLADFQRLEKQFFREVTEKSFNYDVIGVTCTYSSYYRALELIEVIGSENQNIKKVLGGPHVTLMERFPKWIGATFRDSPHLDFLVRGEGEETFSELLQDIGRPEKVKGLSYRRNGEILQNVERESIKDLDILPMPAWEHFDLRRYLRILPVLSARACKFKCVFCDERHLALPYRTRSPELVVDELERNIDKFGVHAFWFSDSTLTSNSLLEVLLDLIIQRKLKISWSAFARADQISERILGKMKLSGCTLLYFGLESGSQKILNLMRKGFKKEQVENAIRLARKHGILTEGSFMIGFPGETSKTARKTIEFAKSLECDLYSWHMFMPSFDMLSRASQFGLQFPSNLDWKNIKGDIPLHLITELARGNEQTYIDRHFIPNLVISQGSIPKLSGRLHDTMSYQEASEWLRKAIEEVNCAEDIEDLRLLLKVYEEQPEFNSEWRSL